MNQLVEKIDPETGEIIEPPKAGTSMALRDMEHLPAEAMDLLDKYAGAGYSDKAEDGITPVLSILQDNSGEVKKQHDRHIPGAEAGMLIIRSIRRIYNTAQRPLLVQPFGFNHVYVEWQGDVGEGIPVGRFMFEDPPKFREEAAPDNPQRKIKRRIDNGNRLVETREHYAVMYDGENDPFPLVIPFSGSNHSPSRQWTQQMKSLMWNGKKLPAFFRFYQLKTMFRKRGSNQSWFMYQIDPGQYIRDPNVLNFGAECYESIKVKPIEANLTDYGTEGEVDDAQQVAAARTVNPDDHI